MAKHILELKTGLYPDAATLISALGSGVADTNLTCLDVSGLRPDDDEAWAAAAEAILAADLTVTA